MLLIRSCSYFHDLPGPSREHFTLKCSQFTHRRRIADGGKGPSSVDVMHREVQFFSSTIGNIREEIDSRDRCPLFKQNLNIVDRSSIVY